MSRVWNRLSSRECPHERTVTVTSVGIRRSVCEDCGHISFATEQKPLRSREISERSSLQRASGF